MINIEQKFRMEGYYSFKAGKGDVERDLSGIIADDHANMILNSGLNAIATGSIATGCRVGTGNAPVTATQTNLISPLATTTAVQSGSQGRASVAPFYTWGRITFRFNQGVAEGNLTEVGIMAGNTLFSRALIVDSQGNPTTLTILSDEWLDVTYELRVYQDLTDKVFNLQLLGENHVATVRAAAVNSVPTSTWTYFFSAMLTYSPTSSNSHHYAGTIQAITGTPSGSSSDVPWSLTNYVENSFKRSVVLNSSLDQNNFEGGIGASIYRTNKATWQVGYEPKISKDNFKILTITITFSWGRYDPEP